MSVSKNPIAYAVTKTKIGEITGVKTSDFVEMVRQIHKMDAVEEFLDVIQDSSPEVIAIPTNLYEDSKSFIRKKGGNCKCLNIHIEINIGGDVNIG